MRVTVTTDTGACSLEVSDDLELENFKALCEVEINIPVAEMALVHNGRPLREDKQSLSSLGVRDGDLIMLVSSRRLPPASSANTTDFSQMDFSSIQVPSAVLGNRATAPEPGPSRRQEEAFTAPGEELNSDVSHEAIATHLSSSNTEGEGSQALEDPAFLLDMLKANPDQLSRLSHNNPALAEAAAKGLEEFSKVLKEQHEFRAERERQRIRMMNADPFDMEAQRMIATEIEKENIEANMEAAMEHHPESFGVVQMLYINCSVNGHPVKAFIDSGAQTTIMSESCARRCNIMRLVDTRWAGVAKGVGTQRIIGRVHMVQLEIGGIFLACSFSILQEQPMDMLLGLDMLKRHQMVIDLLRNVLQIGTSNTSTPFLAESELPECARLTQGSELVHEQRAREESERQAREAEDQDMTRALAASVAEARHEDPASHTPVATPLAPVAGIAHGEEELPAGVTDADVAELMAVGFSRDEVIHEVRRNNGDKTQALAALFAKKFAFPR